MALDSEFPVGTGEPADRHEARDAALRAATEQRTGPAATGLVAYETGGRVLVIGSRERVEAVLPRLEGMGDRVAVITDAQAPSATGDEPAGVTTVYGPLESLQGYLGRFRARLSAGDRLVDLTEVLGEGEDQGGRFDLVLDLQIRPAVQCEQPPFGYYAPRDEQSLEAALKSLPEMIGRFEKPVYLQYDPAVCAHSRQGLTGCSRCIDICPAEAVRSVDGHIEVDTHLCQGAGVCAVACPSGAIRYQFPTLQETLERVRAMLKAYDAAGAAAAPCLLFHDGDEGAAWLESGAVGLPGNLLPVEVEEAGSIGMEVWLPALAYGAAAVGILATAGLPARVKGELQRQLEITRVLLDAVDLNEASVSLVGPGTTDPSLSFTGGPGRRPAGTPAAFAPLDDKRTMLFMALDALFARAGRRRPMVGLPAGAPFGMAQVDGDACTLCLSCVSVCPGRALQDGYDRPQLRFIEANCLQCGLCTRACPEDAIWITPRFLFDAGTRRRMRILHEEAPFNCIRCGRPFTTAKMVERIAQKLRRHWMYQDAAAFKRLRMCEECRVKDLLEAGSAGDEGLAAADGRKMG